MDTVEPELVRTMPLHAITEMHGEAGLRRRFELEIERLSPSDQAVLADALGLADELHRDDRRTREPYVNHLLRSAIRVLAYYRVDDVDVIAATLLHDSVEDHAAELTGRPGSGAETMALAGRAEATAEDNLAALAVLAARFNPRVAALVGAVTNPPAEPGLNRHEQYRAHVAESLADEPWARVIKASDFTDNGVGLIYTTAERQVPLANKYRPLVPVLRDLIARADTPLDDDVKVHICEQLDLAEARFAAILS
jgi:(p)ppGpp synthase/HD superfamily hydrolase